MTLLITSIVLPLIVLFLGKLWGKNNPANTSNFTTGAILLLFLIPLSLFVPTSSSITITTSPALAHIQKISSQNLSSILLILWLVGFVPLLLKFLSSLVYMVSWTRRAKKASSAIWTQPLHQCCEKLQLHTIPPLAISSDISSPMVTGLLYPHILLPESAETWGDDTIEHVLLHELGHIKRRDLWVYFITQLTCIIYWFNPLVWAMKKRITTESEFACDTFVLSSGANAKNYILAMCDVAERTLTKNNPHAFALPMADKCSLKRRVEVLTSKNTASKKVLSLTTLFLLSTSVIALNLTRIEDENNVLIDPKIEAEIRLSADPFPAE